MRCIKPDLYIKRSYDGYRYQPCRSNIWKRADNSDLDSGRRSGNSSSCSFTVTIADHEAPAVVCPVTGNADRSADAGVCSYTVQGTEFDATATDNCTLSTLTYTLSGATTGNGTTLAGVIFGSGQTTVTWMAEDAAGNSSSCSFTVTIADHEAPVVTCPITGNADRNADAGVCSYTVQGTEFDATATDNCTLSTLTYTLSGATTGKRTYSCRSNIWQRADDSDLDGRRCCRQYIIMQLYSNSTG